MAKAYDEFYAIDRQTWRKWLNIEQLIMPEDLMQVFGKNKTALQYFDAFPPSVKKGIYQWVVSAKLPATKSKRIEDTVSLASKNIRANQWKK